MTICTQNRERFFGNVVNGKMCLNFAGEKVDCSWNELSSQFPSIELDEYVIMPDHLQGIIVITGPVVGAPLVGALRNENEGRAQGIAPTLGQIVGAYKSITTHQYIKGVKLMNWPVFKNKLWQRNYYERVIRNERELFEVRKYIQENPLKWDLDQKKSVTGKGVGVPLVGTLDGYRRRAGTRPAPTSGTL